MLRDLGRPAFLLPRSLTVVMLGLLVRLLLAPFTLHVDPQFTGDLAALAIASEHWVSQPDEPWYFLYPPLFYHTLGLYLRAVVEPFAGELLSMPILGLEARFEWLSAPSLPRTLFCLKALYLIPDFAIGLFLWYLLRDADDRKRFLGFAAWVLNPVVLYNAYFHGQFGVIPISFAVLSLVCARSNRESWAAFCMGIAACYKTFPLLLLPPLILILNHAWLHRAKLLAIGLIPYLLLYLPYVDRYSAFRGHSFERFFAASYDLGSGGQVYFFFAIYAGLLWYLYWQQAHTFESLWRACLVILLIYFQFGYFDLHYWLWIVPLTILHWVRQPREAGPLYLVIGLCLVVLLAPTPLARFLAPIDPRLFLRLPSLLELLSPYLPMLFIVNIVRSLLAGTCLYLAYRLLRQVSAPQPGDVEPAPHRANSD